MNSHQKKQAVSEWDGVYRRQGRNFAIFLFEQTVGRELGKGGVDGAVYQWHLVHCTVLHIRVQGSINAICSAICMYTYTYMCKGMEGQYITSLATLPFPASC